MGQRSWGSAPYKGSGTRFLTSDQCWLGRGSWVPVIAQGRRTLCRVQRRDPPPSRGNRSWPAGTLRSSSPRILPRGDQDRGTRKKLHESPANFTRFPEAPRVQGRPGLSIAPNPQASTDPAAPRAQGSPGVCGGAAGDGASPPYHLHLAGIQLAGGRRHGELDLLAVFGVHGGRGSRWGKGRATRGPRRRSRLDSPALFGAAR